MGERIWKLRGPHGKPLASGRPLISNPANFVCLFEHLSGLPFYLPVMVQNILCGARDSTCTSYITLDQRYVITCVTVVHPEYNWKISFVDIVIHEQKTSIIVVLCSMFPWSKHMQYYSLQEKFEDTKEVVGTQVKVLVLRTLAFIWVFMLKKKPVISNTRGLFCCNGTVSLT